VEFTTTQIVAVSILPVLFAITLHEVAHGWVASLCGDQTARLLGRLSLNPLKHIDLVGTVIVPILLLIFTHFIFGWAKPVPIDARNMRNPRRDTALVAAAGPAANLIMAFIWAIIAWISLMGQASLPWLAVPLVYMGEIGIYVNVILAVLNVLPLPPLDGGRILTSLLPPKIAWQFSRIEPYMFFVIVILMLTGLLSYIIVPPVLYLTHWISSLFSLPQLVG